MLEQCNAVADDQAPESAYGMSTPSEGGRIHRCQWDTPRNRTLICTPEELLILSKSILPVEAAISRQDMDYRLIGGDFFK